jgi:hypothetical protein
MERQVAVLCEDCRKPYTARLVDDDVVVPTHDGNCVCGHDGFTEVEYVTDAEG